VARLSPIFIVVSKGEKIQVRKDCTASTKEICHRKAKLGDALHALSNVCTVCMHNLYTTAVYTPSPAALPVDCIWTVESIVNIVYRVIVVIVVARSTLAEKCLLPHFVTLGKHLKDDARSMKLSRSLYLERPTLRPFHI
jgi:hypothetical protein